MKDKELGYITNSMAADPGLGGPNKIWMKWSRWSNGRNAENGGQNCGAYLLTLKGSADKGLLMTKWCKGQGISSHVIDIACN